MSHDLHELEERIKWARQEIAAIEEGLRRYANAHIKLKTQGSLAAMRHRILYGFPKKSSVIRLMAVIDAPVPIAVTARSGTTANELRSCLDGLASVLAERNGRTAKGVYFPIVENESSFDTDKRVKDKVRKLTQEQLDQLMKWRPFLTGNDGKEGNLLLWGLHQSDVARKHHRLAAHVTGGGVVLGDGHVGEMSIEIGTLEVGTTQVGTLSGDSRANLSLIPDFAYAEPDVLRGRPVVETLNEFADLVEAIVSSFKIS